MTPVTPDVQVIKDAHGRILSLYAKNEDGSAVEEFVRKSLLDEAVKTAALHQRPGIVDKFMANRKKILAAVGTALLGFDGLLKAYPDALGSFMKNKEAALFTAGIVAWGAAHWAPPEKSVIVEALNQPDAPLPPNTSLTAPLSSPITPVDKAATA
jgi:hypothetical protein